MSLETCNQPYVINEKAGAADCYDAMLDRLYQAETLAKFTMTETFIESLDQGTADYLWIMMRLLSEARELSGTLMQKFPMFQQHLGALSETS